MLDHPLATDCPAPRTEPWDEDRLAVALAAARHHAACHGRRAGLPACDREDLRQEVLLALVIRAGGHQPALGAWSTYAALVARHALADAAASRRRQVITVVVDTPDAEALPALVGDDPCDGLIARLDLQRLWPALPPRLRAVLCLVAREGSLADACRESAMPPAAFYRAITDLRLWLSAAGLGPREKDREVGR